MKLLFSIAFFILLKSLACGVTFEELNSHASKQAKTWEAWQSKPIEERVAIAPENVIDYLRKDNSYNGYSEIPTSREIDDKQMKVVINAVSSLPSEVKRFISEHVVGIFLVKDLGSTAYTEILKNDDDSKGYKSYIALDVNAINRTANEWATWKENSVFAADSNITIDLKIATDEENNELVTITYVLVHEVGHIVGVANKSHPNWFVGGDPSLFEFSAYSWLYDDKKVSSIYDKAFPLREKVKFYQFTASELKSDSIPEVYRQLKETSFCSLYGAINMYDDFAECFAQYVHVELMKRPYVLTIQAKEHTVLVINEPIRSQELYPKKMFIQKLFQLKNHGEPSDSKRTNVEN